MNCYPVIKYPAGRVNPAIMMLWLLLLWLPFMSQAVTSTDGYKILPITIEQSERDPRQYQAIQLDNGMQVLLISDPQAVKSLGAIAVPVGSLSDPKLQQGLAHYTEHMVLMGSKKYPEPDSFSTYLSQHAGSYNASTAASRTAFYFEVENSALQPALDRLADALGYPLLNPTYADKERNAVNAEMTMARSNDGFRISQVDSETINQAHPAALFSGGNLDTLSDKTDSTLQDALVKFHRDYYAAGIMKGVIYGNASLVKLASLASSSYGRIGNHPVAIVPINEPAITAADVGKRITMQPAQPKKLLYLQFPIANNLAAFKDKSDEYIGYLISNRSEGTLFDSLQKQGLIDSIAASASPDRYGNSGQFAITVQLTEQGLVQQDQVIAAIFSYLKLLQTQGITNAYYQELQKVLMLDFKYPDMVRDMSYVEWLSDQLLHYPLENVINADNLADNFNPPAIAQRLSELTPDNARIWLIAPDVQTNKKAYFVDAPYRIESITGEQKQLWLRLAEQWQFKLPELNPYLANDFSLQSVVPTPLPVTFDPKGNAILLKSDYFADEPKAAMVLSLRHNSLLNDAKQQVLYQLVDYLASRSLAQLRFQASVAGITLTTQTDQGLMLVASGFSQHLTEMLLSVLTHYQNIEVSESDLALAKSWYLERLAAAENVNSYALAMQPLTALSIDHYSEREARKMEVDSISVNDVKQYRDQLLHESVPYLLAMGNLTQKQVEQFYAEVKKGLTEAGQYQPAPPIRVSQSHDASIVQRASSSDAALLLAYLPVGFSESQARAYSYTLYKIISPWFYTELRSNQQLGYAVFMLPVQLGSSAGLGFLIQSNQYDPRVLAERYQAFYPDALTKLRRLSDSEFSQYRDAVINEIKQAPQTLADELNRYLPDYQLSRFSFDSRSLRLAVLSKMTKADLINFYQQSVIKPTGLIFASQVVGQQQDKDKSVMTQWTQYQNASQLQKVLAKE